MDLPEVKDDRLEPGADWLPLGCPRFEQGWRRFCSSVIRESLLLAKFIAEWVPKNEYDARRRYRKAVDDRISNGCAAWLWIAGKGSKDFSFAECCEICSLDPDEARKAFYEVLGTPDDVLRVDRWVYRRCKLTGCIWEDDDL